jgi:hypothetical protein
MVELQQLRTVLSAARTCSVDRRVACVIRPIHIYAYTFPRLGVHQRTARSMSLVRGPIVSMADRKFQQMAAILLEGGG